MDLIKKIQCTLVINSVKDEWHAYPEYHICNKEEVNGKRKLRRSQELLLSSKRLLITYPFAIFIGSIRG